MQRRIPERYRSTVVTMTANAWTRLCPQQPGRKVLTLTPKFHSHIRPDKPGTAADTEGLRVTRNDLIISIGGGTFNATTTYSDPFFPDAETVGGFDIGILSVHVKENLIMFWRDWGPTIELEWWGWTATLSPCYVFETICDAY